MYVFHPGVQLGLVEACKWAGVNPWVQSEPNPGLEISQPSSGDRNGFIPIMKDWIHFAHFRWPSSQVTATEFSTWQCLPTEKPLSLAPVMRPLGFGMFSGNPQQILAFEAVLTHIRCITSCAHKWDLSAKRGAKRRASLLWICSQA